MVWLARHGWCATSCGVECHEAVLWSGSCPTWFVMSALAPHWGCVGFALHCWFGCTTDKFSDFSISPSVCFKIQFSFSYGFWTAFFAFWISKKKTIGLIQSLTFSILNFEQTTFCILHGHLRNLGHSWHLNFLSFKLFQTFQKTTLSGKFDLSHDEIASIGVDSLQ